MRRTARTRPGIGLGLVVVAASLTGWGCRAPETKAENRRVIVITLDTFRADRMGCYGWRQATTPNLDRLARDGILFENAQTTAPLTLPAHSSLMTGLEVHEHGVLNNGYYQLRPEVETLAEVFAAEGWSTGAIISAVVLNSKFGIAQGFDDFDDHIGEQRNTMGIEERRGDESVDLALKWISEHRSERFFLWLHLFDAHFTYDPPEPFKGRFPGMGYEDEIAFVDAQVGRLVDDLKTKGLYDSSLLVVVADHGEAFQEHGEQTHGYYLYEPTMRIPMIIKPAGGGAWKGRRVASRVGIIDLYPTVLDVVGIAAESPGHSTSLKPVWETGAHDDDRVLLGQSITPSFYGANVLHSVSRGNWKLIRDSLPELYDEKRDPGEEHNLASTYPAVVDELGGLLSNRLAESIGAVQRTVSEEDRASLQALGYVSQPSDGRSGEAPFDPSLPPARHFLPAYRLSSNVQVKMLHGQLQEAAELCRAVLEISPEHIESLLDLAEINYRQGDLEQSESLFRRVIDIDPNTFHAWNNLGIVLARENRRQDAIEAFKRAGSLDASYASVPANLGALYREQGETGQAVESFREALEKDPDHFEALRNLGEIEAERGDVEQSRSYLERALGVRPGDADASLELSRLLIEGQDWASAVKVLEPAVEVHSDSLELSARLALTLARSGDLERSLATYRRCLEIDAANAVVLHEAAVVADQLGRSDEAIDLWKRSLVINPDNPQALNGLAWRLAVSGASRPGALDEAYDLAEKACRLTHWSDPSVIDTFAATMAARGDLVSALSKAREALELARSRGQDELSRDIETRIDEYRTELNSTR